MMIVSPGVYTTERDFSLYAPELATSIFGIVTTASKGPINEVTLITDEGSLNLKFGFPSSDHLGLLAAQRYLRKGRQLKVVRVGTYYATATCASFAKIGGGTLQFSIPDDIGPGTWANNLSVVITESSYQAGTYDVRVVDDGITIEIFPRCKVGAANEDDVQYIETHINDVSQYVSVDDTGAGVTMTGGTVTFSGGLDGAPADNSDIIGIVGSPPTVPSTGLQLFANPEFIDVNMIAVPGNTDITIISALVTLAETRADCMALLDTPDNYSVQQAVNWHNGLIGGPLSLVSSYAALYYPWLQVYNSATDANIWAPPVGHAAMVIANTDNVAAPWYAAAGFNRGLLYDVLQLRHSASQGERDFMYGGGNAVNPFVNFTGQGVVLWGQRTCQRTTTALDRINVRRLLLYMRKVIATAVRALVFEPNDEVTWDRFIQLVEPFCAMIKSRRGLEDYQIIADETTTTPLLRDRNQMRGLVILQPMHTAESINIEFILLPSGATAFEEFVA